MNIELAQGSLILTKKETTKIPQIIHEGSGKSGVRRYLELLLKTVDRFLNFVF